MREDDTNLLDDVCLAPGRDDVVIGKRLGRRSKCPYLLGILERGLFAPIEASRHALKTSASFIGP